MPFLLCASYKNLALVTIRPLYEQRDTPIFLCNLKALLPRYALFAFNELKNYNASTKQKRSISVAMLLNYKATRAYLAQYFSYIV